MAAIKNNQTPLHRIARDAAEYPDILRSRLGANAPDTLVLLGDKGLLRSRRTALFCSSRTPGERKCLLR